jgi:predicted O-methyltransferase YrrM
VSSRFVYLHEARRPLAYEPVYRSFEPSFYIPPPGLRGYIDERHEAVPAQVSDIYGKLSPGDHFKLYEAAHFARGSILEIGRLHGKSTAILALALRNRGEGARANGAGGANTLSATGAAGETSGAGGPLYSVELQEKHRPIAEGHLRERSLLELVTLVQGDSASEIASLPGRFDTVFVDGDHSYEGIMRDLHALEGRIEPGGVAMFHDCFHPANATGEYGVARALGERTGAMGLAYRGRFGGIALYEQVSSDAPVP